MFPPLLQWLMYASVVMALGMVVYQVRWVVRELRATRELIRLLAEREEYHPLLRSLMPRLQHADGRLQITEHEAIDLREAVRRAALVHLQPGDRRRVEQGLYAPMVAEREGYLRNVLSASIGRMQRQAA
jgi:hypothetical protein